MGKQIVFCADGTWDTTTSHTNVYRIYKALLVTADQMPFYDDGVGADGNPIIKLVGGAFGTGLWQKIKDGYAKIAHVYEAGDSVFLFGFSRGAYTARSLAGMIACAGLPTANFTEDMVNTAFDAYRAGAGDLRQQKLEELANCDMDDNPTIEMVGVWDTVGSLGIPAAIGQVDPVAYGFLDTSLNPKIKHGYHALAIDERRAQFPPTLWEGTIGPDQTIEQVWFTGAHSDVGGGEPSDGTGTTALSDITLAWMMDKASALGLLFDTSVQKQYACPLDPTYALDQFHESWKFFCGFPIRRTIDQQAAIANSVVIRCEEEANWRPRNLSFVNGSLAGSYQMVSVCNQPAAAAAAATKAVGAQSAGGAGT
jgi:uncharacterized protein (DUF2235 family)